MAWYEITVLVIGVPGSIEIARRTVWKWFRGLMRGWRAIEKFGQALPDLSALPKTLPRLETKIDAATKAADEVKAELREHMAIEDAASLVHEKAWAQLIATQHQLAKGQADTRHEIDNLRQIVMNGLDTGAGDRWRLTHQEEQSSPTDS